MIANQDNSLQCYQENASLHSAMMVWQLSAVLGGVQVPMYASSTAASAASPCTLMFSSDGQQPDSKPPSASTQTAMPTGLHRKLLWHRQRALTFTLYRYNITPEYIYLNILILILNYIYIYIGIILACLAYLLAQALPVPVTVNA